ncbi:MAG: alpha/beta hydrolase [Thermoanaerobaculia bacterium]
MIRTAALLLLVLALPLPAETIPAGEIVDGIAARSDPTQTYAVYLPRRYDPEKRYPLLAVFDPRSRGAMAAELFRDAAEARAWIVISSNDTRSDGPWEPNVRAVNAIFPDALARFSVDTRRVYAAGFSGGAILAWVVGQTSGRLAGIIGVGGRLPDGLVVRDVRLAHYGAAGNRDFNFAEMKEIEALLDSEGATHRLEIFEGGHQWLPPAMTAEAIDWLEIVAMRDGLRPVDEALVAAVLEREVAAAKEYESAGRRLAAARRWRVIADSFAGIVDTAAYAQRAESLFRSRDVQRERREETRSLAFEERRVRDVQLVLAKFRNPEIAVTPARLAHELGVASLVRQAKRTDAAGDAAGRVLASLHVQLSFYLPRDEGTSEHDAVLYLEVARTIEKLMRE